MYSKIANCSKTAYLVAIPLFLRVPREGETCQVTGLAKNATNELILGDAPPVASFTISADGNPRKRGARIIIAESLGNYLKHGDGRVFHEEALHRSLPEFIKIPARTCPLTGFNRSLLYSLTKPPVGLRMSSVHAPTLGGSTRGRRLIAVSELLEVILRCGSHDENARGWLRSYYRILQGRHFDGPVAGSAFLPEPLEEGFIEQDDLERDIRQRLADLGVPYRWVSACPGALASILEAVEIHGVEVVVRDLQNEPDVQ